MSSPNIVGAPTARNAVPSASMKRALDAMARYPFHVVKPARLNTGCAACGCPVQPNTLPDWPDVDLHAEYPL